MKFNIAVIPGDGIGPEVINQAKKSTQRSSKTRSIMFLFIKKRRWELVQLMQQEIRYQTIH